MSISLADARFQWQRALGLIRRGMSSLRTRGWRASWERVKRQFQRVPQAQRAELYSPAEAPFAPFAVPDSTAPRASIVIPVYNQAAHTLACLRALAEHPPAASCEILVVDDGSSDQTGDWMAQVSGLHFHRRAVNGGFIAACNDGAERARGEFLVFLNNDTVPQPGWLDALLDTFRVRPDAGLIGAQLLYPDGRLQEAGGVVRNDGRADNIGRFQSPLHPVFSYLRQVDYCSGAAIAVPAALFAQAGGFDTHFSPAYYEDTDLGLRMRALGHEVLYQPEAKVVHLEGATAGTDPDSGIKAYQVSNRDKFEARWRDALARHPDHETPIAELTRRHYRRQILVIDAQTPRPDHDSGSLRMFNLMRLLCDEGAHVVFMPANQQHDGGYTGALQRLGVEAWYAPFAGRAPAWLREHGPRFDTVLLSRHYVASEFLPLVRRHAPQAKVVFDSVDLHYLREERGARMARDEVLRASARRTRASELKVVANADTTLVVSAAERELLAADAPGAQVELLSNLHEVAGAGAAYAQRKDLVFVGGFRHPRAPAGRGVPLHRQRALRCGAGLVRVGWGRGPRPCPRPGAGHGWDADCSRAVALWRRGQGQGQPEHGPRPAGGGDDLRGGRHAPAGRTRCPGRRRRAGLCRSSTAPVPGRGVMEPAGPQRPGQRGPVFLPGCGARGGATGVFWTRNEERGVRSEE